MIMRNMIHVIVSKLFWGVLIHIVNDKWYAKIRYWLVLKKWGDFENPTLFTEKIQHIKLYERTPIRKLVADRIKVREYVSEKVGSEPLIPLLGSYKTMTKEAWDSLPQQFVLKANHGCGMVKIIRSKSDHSYKEIFELTETWKNTDYYKAGREWVYKGLSREIIAEQLLTDSQGQVPKDWKFFCFDGKVKVIQEDIDRFGTQPQRRNLYDRNFKKIEAELLYPATHQPSKKPALLDEAIRVSEALSQEFNFIRVDLYITDDQIYFGELTNYPGNGFIPFQPRFWEYEIGAMLDLN